MRTAGDVIAPEGRVDPRWVPLSVTGDKKGAGLADSGKVIRLCTADYDCSYNGVCSAGACECTQGWTGHRCDTLDLLPVDKAKLGFSPQDADGNNRSSWGGTVWQEGSTWHMWAAGDTL